MDVLERIFKIAQKYNVELKSNVEFAEAKLADGTTITTPAEAMEVGVEVFVVNADGEQMPVPDGTYTLENGAEIVVASGMIESITEAPEEAPAEEPAEAPVAEVEAAEDQPLDEVAKEAIAEAVAEKVEEAVAEKVEEEMKKYREEIEAQKEQMAKMEESFSAKRPAKAKVRKTENVNLKELNDKNRVTALFNRYYNG